MIFLINFSHIFLHLGLIFNSMICCWSLTSSFYSFWTEWFGGTKIFRNNVKIWNCLLLVWTKCLHWISFYVSITFLCCDFLVLYNNWNNDANIDDNEIHSVQFSHSVTSWLFVTPWTAAHQSSLSITISWSLLKLMSSESVMPFNHLILCRPFSSCFQSFPASGSFPVSQFFVSGSQSFRASASASVLLVNIQDWFPVGLTGLISFQSKGLSRVFSNTTVQKHQFFDIQLSLWSNSHIYWRRQWHPTPVLLPGESHGRRSLVGCSPWGR